MIVINRYINTSMLHLRIHILKCLSVQADIQKSNHMALCLCRGMPSLDTMSSKPGDDTRCYSAYLVMQAKTKSGAGLSELPRSP
jgi:hypothetical protein